MRRESEQIGGERAQQIENESVWHSDKARGSVVERDKVRRLVAPGLAMGPSGLGERRENVGPKAHHSSFDDD